MIDRVIWIILDSVGMGALPDADRFGDEMTNTIEHVARYNNGLDIPNMTKLGIGNIDGMDFLERTDVPMGAYGRSAEISNGKDTTIGHWEMIGIHSPKPFPTYPEGFDREIIDMFLEKSGLKKTGIDDVLGNCTASGTEIIKRLGEEHIKTKKPIVYTSADSVFQIACHEDVYSNEELYSMCRAAREILKGENALARVIARPFYGTCAEDFQRSSARRDFSLRPDEKNLLVYMKNNLQNVVGVGKIEDIFAGQGITEAVHTKDNEDGMDRTLEYMDKVENGLIFTNLVEFDSKWGHRNDPEGYGKGLEAFDKRLAEVLRKMRESDLLIINADHGCDPTTKGTDHTREYIPVLVYHKNIKPDINLGTLETFADIGQTIAEIMGVKKLEIGNSFLGKIV